MRYYDGTLVEGGDLFVNAWTDNWEHVDPQGAYGLVLSVSSPRDCFQTTTLVLWNGEMIPTEWSSLRHTHLVRRLHG